MNKGWLMRSGKYEPILIGVSYFLILLCIAFWVRDIPNQPDVFVTTIQQLIDTSKLGDPKYFATAAIEIASKGWVSSSNAWVLNLWPPGFVLLEALIIKMFGLEAPVLLILQIQAALLFTGVLLLLNRFLSTKVKNQVAYILPLLIFTFPVSRVFLLQPTGISLGESFSIGFFILSVLLSIKSVENNQLRHAVNAGCFLALSAYFRSQFELILLALTLWGVLLLITFLVVKQNKFIEQKIASSTITTVAVVLLVAHAATIPWRAYHLINDGNLLWVQTSSVTFGNAVSTSENLESRQGKFVVEGGGNLVCRIDPTTCGDVVNAKKLFIKTFLEHPIQWYSLKLDVVGKYWFSSIQNWTNTGVAPLYSDMALNGIILILIIVNVPLLLTRKVRSERVWLLLMWICTSLISTYILIFTVQQFETRYFYFPKIFGIFMVLILASMYYRNSHNVDKR